MISVFCPWRGTEEQTDGPAELDPEETRLDKLTVFILNWGNVCLWSCVCIFIFLSRVWQDWGVTLVNQAHRWAPDNYYQVLTVSGMMFTSSHICLYLDVDASTGWTVFTCLWFCLTPCRVYPGRLDQRDQKESLVHRFPFSIIFKSPITWKMLCLFFLFSSTLECVLSTQTST